MMKDEKLNLLDISRLLELNIIRRLESFGTNRIRIAPRKANQTAYDFINKSQHTIIDFGISFLQETNNEQEIKHNYLEQQLEIIKQGLRHFVEHTTWKLLELEEEYT